MLIYKWKGNRKREKIKHPFHKNQSLTESLNDQMCKSQSQKVDKINQYRSIFYYESRMNYDVVR